MKKQTPLATIPQKTTVLIVGGGIVGAGIFRDLSLHDIPTILIDKKDFSSQTSQSSSKMLHGGIRYLENFDFKLIWEALHEKNLWLKIAPHLCRDCSFYLPAFKESKRPLWMLKIGLMLYDLLSSYQNTPHKMLNSVQTVQKIPTLKSRSLSGSGVYHDALVDDAKMTIDVILDGQENKLNHALNYVGLIDLKHCGEYSEATLEDSLTGERKTIRATEVVFATGPFTDKLLKKFPEFQWTDKLIPSKGSHIWLKKTALPLTDAMLLQTKDDRVIFVIPQKGAILVGTTEVPVDRDLFDAKPTQQEIDYLLQVVNEYFPQSQLGHDAILSSFAGIRPLVKEGDENDLGKTAREHKTYQPFSNVHVIVGGKYTTFRVMGQEISRIITHRCHKAYNPNRTKQVLRYQSKISCFAEATTITPELIMEIVKNEQVRTFQDLIRRRLSLPGVAHWQQQIPFAEFFIKLLPQLNEYFPVTAEEINHYK